MSVLTLAHEVELATPCRSHDPELWFSELSDQIERAQVLCRSCPLMTACLAGALERREPWGVWGGELFERGVIVARKRPKGRPRKDDGAAADRAASELAARLADVETELADELGLEFTVVVPAPRRGVPARSAVAQVATGRRRTRDGAAA